LQDFQIARFAGFKRLKNQAIRQFGNKEIWKIQLLRCRLLIVDCGLEKQKTKSNKQPPITNNIINNISFQR